MSNNNIDSKVKEILKEIESKSDFIIDIMETDKDHIHLLVSFSPKISISSIVRKLKQKRTIELWKYFTHTYLSAFGKNILSLDGYFVCLITEASPETIRSYIKTKDNLVGIHPID